MTVYLGHAALKGDFRRYTRQFNFLELSADAGRLPKRARLREWAALAPEGFLFSLVLPAEVGALEEGPDAERARDRALLRPAPLLLS